MKNPPGGERCWRVIKNRYLFPLHFATQRNLTSVTPAPQFVLPLYPLILFLSFLTSHYFPLPPRVLQQPASLLPIYPLEWQLFNIKVGREIIFNQQVGLRFLYIPLSVSVVSDWFNISLFTFTMSAIRALLQYKLYTLLL